MNLIIIEKFLRFHDNIFINVSTRWPRFIHAKWKYKTYTLSTSLFCFSYNIFIQSIYDRQKGKNARGIFLVPLIHITEYLYDSWRRTLFIEHQIEVKKHALDHVHNFVSTWMNYRILHPLVSRLQFIILKVGKFQIQNR